MKRLIQTTVLLFSLVATASFGQSRATYFDLAADIIPPAGYDTETEYPLLILLPYTTGTAEEFYKRYKSEIDPERYVILLPKGRPVRSDYLPDFMQYVDWYEERLLTEIDRARRMYPIDNDAIILAGYSLGGDLSWALTMKQPELFAGAIMAGTRCSYPPGRAGLETLEKNGFRAAFFTGRREDINRYDGMNAAKWTLENTGIAVQYTEVAGKHVPPPVQHFSPSLNWILKGKTTPSAEKRAGTGTPDSTVSPEGVYKDEGADVVSGATVLDDMTAAYTLRLVNNSGLTIHSIELQPESYPKVMPLMGTYMGDDPLPPGGEISFDLSYGDYIIIEGEGGFVAETPKVRGDVLMVLKPNGKVKVYK